MVETLTDAEYRSHMDLVAAAVRMLRILPLQQLRDIVERAETLAPLLEPTAYQRGGADNLLDQRDILDAAIGLVRAAERVEQRAEARRG